MFRTYPGSCHCGRIRFEVDADLDHVRSCDCSICTKRGALVHRVEKELSEDIEPFDGWGVNVRCLDGVDLSDIPLKEIFGSRM